jgi:steroid delta-isomerase-like uncharacterized protein
MTFEETAPMSDANKALVRRFFEEMWNNNTPALADELVAANYTHHDPANPTTPPGPAGQKQLLSMYITAFPDSRFTVDDIIAEGDMVVARWTARGTHRGELQGIAPTGKQVTVTGISCSRMSGGKMVEGWINWDTLGMMQQLGLVPMPAATTA